MQNQKWCGTGIGLMAAGSSLPWRQPASGAVESILQSYALRANRQNLPAFVVAARGAGCMRRYRASALGAFVQLRGLPAMRGLARAQPHLRSFAFGNSHK